MPATHAKDKKEILTRADLCKECLSCMYECSIHAFGCFNLSKSRIQILYGYPNATIAFSDDCDLCYRCVGICPHHALYLENDEVK